MSKLRLTQLQQNMVQFDQDNANIISEDSSLSAERYSLGANYDQWCANNSKEDQNVAEKQNKVADTEAKIKACQNAIQESMKLKETLSSFLSDFSQYQLPNKVNVLGSIDTYSQEQEDSSIIYQEI